jgi:hypothetical protein
VTQIAEWVPKIAAAQPLLSPRLVVEANSGGQDCALIWHCFASKNGSSRQALAVD